MQSYKHQSLKKFIVFILRSEPKYIIYLYHQSNLPKLISPYKQSTICFGEENVRLKPRSARAAKDFSYFLNEIPGCYFFIANGEKSECCHNSKFDFNDKIIKQGAKVFRQIALCFLAAST
ncbi:M20/M25/M40 family metallo-hydrolase [Candidatus Berkiella aquae]|uniref:M20/M25/M40 family metallo-hydrolase n=1 Tax=Candidatus Berkiella aquae TaxID=295108 RepID=UPI0009467886